MTPTRTSLQHLLDLLERFYGPLPLPPHDAFALYVWEVVSVHTAPGKRDAAMAALRRIRALTPDAMARVPRGKLEAAVALAGPYREERLRALTAGADIFRRKPDLPRALRAPLPAATEALAELPHLSAASGQRMLLLAGDHAIMPGDPRLIRVALRLGYGSRSEDFSRSVSSVQEALAAELGGVLPTVQRAASYLAHHGLTTCLEADPRCYICPLRNECPSAR